MGNTVVDLAQEMLSDDTIIEYLGNKSVRDSYGFSRSDDPYIACPIVATNAPIYWVNHHNANTFCLKITEITRRIGILSPDEEFRLPTEAEWEYACRAGTTTSLPSGKEIYILGENNAPLVDEIAWYGGNSSVDFTGANGELTIKWREKQFPGGVAGPHPVGEKQANNWGLFDTIGNVWEWCCDGYADYPTTATINPKGSTKGGSYVLRGGSWNFGARFCRSACRGGTIPIDRSFEIGFRVVVAPVQQSRGVVEEDEVSKLLRLCPSLNRTSAVALISSYGTAESALETIKGLQEKARSYYTRSQEDGSD